jgi:hypothetical protein
MQVVDRPLPELGTLIERLTVVLQQPHPVEVVQRIPQLTGSFPKEVVHCRLHDGRELKLFCKYSAPRFEAFGHRRGIAYEATIYERVLAVSGLSAPTRAGWFHDPDTGEAWLMVGYLEEGCRTTDRWSELDMAARWLGDFHRLYDSAETDDRLAFLIRYDRAYYEGWAARTAAFSDQLSETRHWLPRLCDAFTERVSQLIASPQTVVHGEYTVHNVMMQGAHVYPVDWESAAIGFGEIDLACLLDNCGGDVIEKCTRAYVMARWPGGEPSDLPARLLTAEIYLHLRWLGEDPAQMATADGKRRLERLRIITGTLGIAEERA